MQIKLEAAEVRELRLAVNERVDALKKLRKKVDAAGLDTAEIDVHLHLMEGDDAVAGLRDRLSEQLSVLEAEDLFAPADGGA